jgi:hypothetical protein
MLTAPCCSASSYAAMPALPTSGEPRTATCTCGVHAASSTVIMAVLLLSTTAAAAADLLLLFHLLLLPLLLLLLLLYLLLLLMVLLLLLLLLLNNCRYLPSSRHGKRTAEQVRVVASTHASTVRPAATQLLQRQSMPTLLHFIPVWAPILHEAICQALVRARCLTSNLATKGPAPLLASAGSCGTQPHHIPAVAHASQPAFSTYALQYCTHEFCSCYNHMESLWNSDCCWPLPPDSTLNPSQTCPQAKWTSCVPL